MYWLHKISQLCPLLSPRRHHSAQATIITGPAYCQHSPICFPWESSLYSATNLQIVFRACNSLCKLSITSDCPWNDMQPPYQDSLGLAQSGLCCWHLQATFPLSMFRPCWPCLSSSEEPNASPLWHVRTQFLVTRRVSLWHSGSSSSELWRETFPDDPSVSMSCYINTNIDQSCHRIHTTPPWAQYYLTGEKNQGLMKLLNSPKHRVTGFEPWHSNLRTWVLIRTHIAFPM